MMAISGIRKSLLTWGRGVFGRMRGRGVVIVVIILICMLIKNIRKKKK